MKNLLNALASFQKDPTIIGKTEDNPYFSSKYVPLDKLMLRVREKLNEHGLTITQYPTTVEGGFPALATMLFHAESGEYLETIARLILVKDDPQAQGSAITYMRRYSIESILGIVTTKDDDANQATFSDDTLDPKEIKTVTKEIKDTLDDAQQKELKAWMKKEKLSLKPGVFKRTDTERLYEKISEIKEPIEEEVAPVQEETNE